MMARQNINRFFFQTYKMVASVFLHMEIKREVTQHLATHDFTVFNVDKCAFSRDIFIFSDSCGVFLKKN